MNCPLFGNQHILMLHVQHYQSFLPELLMLRNGNTAGLTVELHATVQSRFYFSFH